jgi:hypothetical protein
VLAELATSLTAREARVDKSIATTINPAAAKPPTTGTTSDGAAGNGGQ